MTTQAEEFDPEMLPPQEKIRHAEQLIRDDHRVIDYDWLFSCSVETPRSKRFSGLPSQSLVTMKDLHPYLVLRLYRSFTVRPGILQGSIHYWHIHRLSEERGLLPLPTLFVVVIDFLFFVLSAPSLLYCACTQATHNEAITRGGCFSRSDSHFCCIHR